MKFTRVFAMPSAETFSIPPIRAFLARYISREHVTLDPFARNNTWATFSNDLNPNTAARYHVDAGQFCSTLKVLGAKVDVALFDPPYSPRQISEVYASIGLPCTSEDTQNARLYKRVRDVMAQLVRPNGVVLSFGWNSAGMGKGRGYTIEEILLVAHGGAHNDTICVAERRLTPSP